MKNFDSIILGTSIILGFGLLYLNTRESKIEKMKKIGIKKAEEITITHFKKLLTNNKEITIEEAILDFENAKTNSLEKYAKKKQRTKESYIKSYIDFFLKAKKD